MSTIKGNEAAELVPASLQLAPLFQILILNTLLVEQLLGSHITVFHTEASLVHAPERQSRHRIIEPGSHLRAHVLPTCSYITTPRGCRVSLLACKATPRQQKHTRLISLALEHRALSVVDGIGIHDAIGIEILRGRAEGSRSGEGFAIPHRGTVAHIGLRCIHPPGIYAILVFGIEVVVHLTPEHLTCAGIIGIIERTAESQPVVNIVGNRLMVHPALCVEFLVIVYRIVELRPDANHKPASHLVNTVEHSLRMGESATLKSMVAPRVQFPIVPVLNNIVDGYLATAELAKRLFYLCRSLIALTALPKAQHPLRIYRSLARKCAIAADNLISILPGDEVVVHILGHLAPNGKHALAFTSFGSTQSAVADVTIGPPLDAQLVAITLQKPFAELIGIGVPCGAPTLGNDFLAANIDFYISCIIKNEMILSIRRCLNKSLVNDRRTIQGKAFWQVLDTARFGTIGQV